MYGVEEFSWLEWQWDPLTLVLEILLLQAYLLGVGPLRQRYGWAALVEPRQVALFLGGLLFLFLAEHSPLHALSEGYLFSAHMLQHLLLVLVVPPLLLAGTPSWLGSALLRMPGVLPVARRLTHPLIAFGVFNLVLVVWHLPEIYDQAIFHTWVHFLEHVLFVGTALLAWWPVLSLAPELPRLSYPLRMLYLFAQSLPMGFLGAVQTFSTGVIYQGYAAAPELWGMTPLADQQMGGLLMKVGGGLGFFIALAVVFFCWATHAEDTGQPVLEERQPEYR